jgi:two-component system, sensor histidine kinase and response regulator
VAELRSRVLIVDDIPANIQLVASILRPENYDLNFAQNGIDALQLLSQRPFDLILLDLHMPEMDGFQVCEKLKENPDLKEIPVIFLTAISETDQIVKGLRMGAVDYITKPFEPLELLARVRTQLALKAAWDKIRWQNKELERLNTEKSELMGMVAHDLKNPLTVIFSGVEYLRNRETGLAGSSSRRLNNMLIAVQRMNALVGNFLSLESIEAGKLRLQSEPIQAAEILRTLVAHYQEWANLRAIEVHLEIQARLPIETDPLALQQILENLFSNALKYTPTQKKIWLRLLHQPESIYPVRFEIEDQGPGIELSEQEHLFKAFTPLSSPLAEGEHSTGLGLAIVKKLTALLGGQVSYKSEWGEGSCFIVELPLLPQNKEL